MRLARITFYSGTNRLYQGYGKTYTYDEIGRTETVSPNTNYYYDDFTKRVSKIYYGTSDDNYTYLYTYNWRGYRVRDYVKHILRELGGGRRVGSIEIYEKEYIHFYSTTGNLLCDYDKNGNLIAKYVYLPGAVVKETSTDTLYLILNRQGSPVVITDKNGIVKKQYRYYAYGAIRSQTGSISNNYLYTGYIKDNTGLYYARARYYIEGFGRFITPDPILSINPYAYCSGDPVNYIDPGGMRQHTAIDPTFGEKWGEFDWLDYIGRSMEYQANHHGPPPGYNLSNTADMGELWARGQISWTEYAMSYMYATEGINGLSSWLKANFGSISDLLAYNYEAAALGRAYLKDAFYSLFDPRTAFNSGNPYIDYPLKFMTLLDFEGNMVLAVSNFYCARNDLVAVAGHSELGIVTIDSIYANGLVLERSGVHLYNISNIIGNISNSIGPSSPPGYSIPSSYQLYQHNNP